MCASERLALLLPSDSPPDSTSPRDPSLSSASLSLHYTRDSSLSTLERAAFSSGASSNLVPTALGGLPSSLSSLPRPIVLAVSALVLTPLSAISGYLWWCPLVSIVLEMFGGVGGVWRCLEVFRGVWRRMAVFGGVWRCHSCSEVQTFITPDWFKSIAFHNHTSVIRPDRLRSIALHRS